MHRRALILKSIGFNNVPIINEKVIEPDAIINVEKEEEQYNPRTIFNGIIELSTSKIEKGETKKKRKKEVIDQLKEYFELNLPISRNNDELFNFE